MLKSCDSKEFCGRNGRLEGEVKEAVPSNISLRIVVDLENPWKDLESGFQKSVGTLKKYIPLCISPPIRDKYCVQWIVNIITKMWQS